jgi:hypothetical protein
MRTFLLAKITNYGVISLIINATSSFLDNADGTGRTLLDNADGTGRTLLDNAGAYYPEQLVT